MTKKKNTTVKTDFNTEKEFNTKVPVSEIGKLETMQNNINSIRNVLCDILKDEEPEKEPTKDEIQEEININKYQSLLKVKDRAESVFKLFDFIANG